MVCWYETTCKYRSTTNRSGTVKHQEWKAVTFFNEIQMAMLE